MIGRDLDITTIRGLIGEHRQRLVTLIGVGGAGKSRLAVQVAADLLDEFADGVWFVELASISRPDLVPHLVAGVLGISEAADLPMIDTVLGFVQRKRLLLVLDNCEHLIDACASLAKRLLTTCPDLSILATSREPLRISGERRWRVPPLAVPAAEDVASLDALANSPSVRLFEERAQAIDAGFHLAEPNAAAVAQICTRLDGIPLAIELAAARIAMLTAEQIAARLDDCFQLLARGTRDGPTRHQTMQAALAWSYDLLTPAEQAVFRTLSAFAGSFDLDAAETIVGTASPGTQPAALSTFDALSQLVDKSLVVTEQATRGRRYRLLEPVRQYAQRLLTSAGEDKAARSRHAAHFAALATRVAPLIHGPEQIAWLDRLDEERDNLRLALAWSTGCGDDDARVSLTVAMAPYWEARGYLGEGRRWLESVLAATRDGGVSDAIRMQALLAAGTLARLQRDLPPARELLNEALEAARRLGNRRREAEALSGLASVLRHLDEVEHAVQLSEASVQLARVLDDDTTLAHVLHHHGMAMGAWVLVSGSQDALDEAVSVLEESLMRYRRLGDVRQIATTATVLGRTLRLTGDHTRAAAVLREAMVTLSAVRDRANMVDALGGLAYAAMALGESRHAARWLAASQALREALGMRYSARNRAYDQSISEALQREMGVSAFDETYNAGATLTLDQILAEIVTAE
jgi:non-specific serine/threonine protein kinase